MWIRKIFYRHDTENTAFSEKLPQIKNVFKFLKNLISQEKLLVNFLKQNKI